jgi:lysophospholipase L1-like esterase
MHKLLICLLLFAWSACEKADSPKPTSTSINKIMSLGASRVEGNRPDFESFRYELWKDLIANNWTFDFIGTQSDEALYPSYNNQSFDIDHEGRGGWTSGQILADLAEWLNETSSPDIVLFSSPGGNDALQNLPYNETINNIQAIIDLLQSNNPAVIILIEQLAPGRSDIMTPTLSNYFSQLQVDIPTIASNQSDSLSQVITVDMQTGFNDNLLADEVHYNEAGADFIAARYYTVLATILEQ